MRSKGREDTTLRRLGETEGYIIRARWAREHFLENADVDIPRDVLVVSTDVSGSGKSSLEFGTLLRRGVARWAWSATSPTPGPVPGEEGGRGVTAGTPVEVSQNDESRTAPFLSRLVEF